MMCPSPQLPWPVTTRHLACAVLIWACAVADVATASFSTEPPPNPPGMPDVRARSVTISDSSDGGNGNGLAEPGESVSFEVLLENIASTGVAGETAVNVTATLSLTSPDSDITIVGAVATVSSIAHRSSAAVSFGVTVASNAVPRDVAYTVSLTWDGQQSTHPVVAGRLLVPVSESSGPRMVLRTWWVNDFAPDGDDDGVAEPGETVYPRIRIENVGGLLATNVTWSVSTDDPDVSVLVPQRQFAAWEAGLRRHDRWFVLRIAQNSEPHNLSLQTTVQADQGSWTFSVVIPIQAPRMQFATSWVNDFAPDGNDDGLVQAGETVQPRIRLLNDGDAPATDVTWSVTTEDSDVTTLVSSRTFARWEAGLRRHDRWFKFAVSATAVPHTLEFTTTVVAREGTWSFPISIPMGSPSFVFRTSWINDPAPGGNGDGLLQPGETVHPRVRLENVGAADATNITWTVTTTDTDVTTLVTDRTFARWEAGLRRHDQWFQFSVASGASPHDITLDVSVTSDQGSWTFAVTAPLVGTPLLEFRTYWINDPAPDGNNDGLVQAGETVFPRIRLVNTGDANATNVAWTVTTSDSDVTMLVSQRQFNKWETGLRRHDQWFQFSVDGSANPHDISLTVSVTSDEGSWSFLVAVPLTGTPNMDYRTHWINDFSPDGNDDGQLQAGETVYPRIRIVNDGDGDATNVTWAVNTTDSDVTMLISERQFGKWEAGLRRHDRWFRLSLDSGASAHDITLDVSVTSDQGSWSFTVTVPMAAVSSTALLANFPNPFNPETWIPFYLDSAGTVAVRIYSVDGVLVRELDLGDQPAGLHGSRDTSAYWDGRNSLGERVASGMYVYELTTGSYRAARRMVIRK
jgi:hypothetical protein